MSKGAPYEAAAVAQVNGRLEKQEEEGKDGDPAFPKQQWPPSKLCPLCHLPNSQVRLHTCTVSRQIMHPVKFALLRGYGLMSNVVHYSLVKAACRTIRRISQGHMACCGGENLYQGNV